MGGGGDWPGRSCDVLDYGERGAPVAGKAVLRRFYGGQVVRDA
jgi:hypothetical protein